ncbi:DNA helicase PIF1, ATP-dependent [Tanacetum coccineum]
MTGDSANDCTIKSPLLNILNKSVFIHSHTTVRPDGRVQSYCGLKLADIPASGADLRQETDSGSKYAHTRARRRSAGPSLIRAAKKMPKGAALTSAGIPVAYHNLGPPSYECPACHAVMWYGERNDKAKRDVNLTFSLCCQEGKVLLPLFNETPPPLKQLLDYKDTTTSRFREQIRVYNIMFSFTSFGVKIDHSINTGRGPYTFRINGQNYHRMGSLLPAEGVQPRYAQLYFFDTQNEIRNRMSAFMDNESREKVDKNIVADLTQMLDHSNPIVRSFRMAKEWCHSNPSTDFGLRLLSERKTTRQYNAPTVSEVATLIINDFGDGEPSRDIIVNKTNSGPQRISELHPSYTALQYPLLFPYGEDGFHEHIPYHRNTGERKTKRGDVTMNEYYAYIVQQRKNQGNTLLKGGRLFQQYLVDVYTAVEEQRLKWTKNNQDTLRVDLYHNLCDAVTRGDTSAAGLGKRIFLQRSFTGSPRLPYAHILLWLEERWKCRNPAEIDDIISAELPSPIEDLEGYKVVTEYMSKAIKYLFKYLNKGLDRATIIIQENVKGGQNGTSKQVLEVDEIKNFHNCQFLAPCEAVWRLFSYDIHYSYPTVMQLSFHLPDQNAITMRDSQNLSALLESEEEQLRNYCLLEIQELLNRHGKSLGEFQDLPQPNPSKVEHEQLHSMLNPEQRLIYEQVIESVYNQKGQFSFIHGPGGTGKTFLYKTIIARLRSARMIVLAVASSGIASLLLPEGRTAHSRFVRPLELMENSTCDGFWLLAMANCRQKKEAEDEPTWIQIPEEFLIKSRNTPIEKIVSETYLNFTTRQTDDQYLKERAILTLRNDDADEINEYMFNKLGGETVTYNSADKICKGSTDTLDQHNLYPIEFLNSLNFPGMPPHALCLKKELPIILIRNVDPSNGLCNGTRLIITELAQFLYAALSRVTTPDGLKILMIEDEDKELKHYTRNIVFKEAFNNL